MLVCLFVFVVSPCFVFVFFFKQKTAYEMRISDWSSDVCSSDLIAGEPQRADLDVELAIARAQADAAAGYPGLARRRLAPLAAAYPGDRRIQRLLGDMGVAAGDRESVVEGQRADVRVALGGCPQIATKQSN